MLLDVVNSTSSAQRLLTFSRSIAFIAESMPFTTFAMLPVTWRIVTAVWTLLLTASRRDANRNRFRRSFCLRMAFCAYILAMSEWFCWMAWRGGLLEIVRGCRRRGEWNIKLN